MKNGRKSRHEQSVGERIIQGLREFTEVLESGDDLSKHFTVRRVSLDLKPRVYTGAMVKKTRKLLGTSQAVFADFLGVSPKTVRAWEQGINTPSDIACRFMDEIQHNPQYWNKRLNEAIVVK